MSIEKNLPESAILFIACTLGLLVRILRGGEKISLRFVFLQMAVGVSLAFFLMPAASNWLNVSGSILYFMAWTAGFVSSKVLDTIEKRATQKLK